MKNISVFGDTKKAFETYFVNSLESLKIDFNIASPNSKDESESLDYVVLNNINLSENKAYRANYCLVNTDSNIKKNIAVDGTFLSYGIGGRNTITVSSLQDENFVYCIQRYLNIKPGLILEPQEIPVAVEILNEDHLYSLMAAVTIGLIEGVSPTEIQTRLIKKYIYK